MVLTQTPVGTYGWKAPSFMLTGVDGTVHCLQDLKGKQGTVVAFICNHCPYVEAIIDRMVRAARDMRAFEVSMIAICSNDSVFYPEDSYENMQYFARRNGFDFPYLHDSSQEIAKAYGAVCTPDFFGFDAKLKLEYRGRLDEGHTDVPPQGQSCELLEAMRLIAGEGKGPVIQYASLGCSIKWCV